jgi:LPXTG-motif cell wall-anchored protein
LFVGLVMSLALTFSASSAQAQTESNECYPPTAECGSTTSIAVVATTAAQAPTGDELARTGSDTTVPYTAIAAVLIAGGGLIVLAGRRRSAAS